MALGVQSTPDLKGSAMCQSVREALIKLSMQFDDHEPNLNSGNYSRCHLHESSAGDTRIAATHSIVGQVSWC
jgi:hypothetical protein